MEQRYFKLLTNGGFGDIVELGSVYLMESMTGDNIAYDLVIPNYGHPRGTLHFFAREVEEVFNYNPILDKVEEVADLVFRTNAQLNNYNAMLGNKPDSKGERWIEETEELVGKTPYNVVDDNGVKCVYRDGIREFETGAVRSDNRGRERYDLIPQLALDMAAEVFGKNCGEFGSGNHLKCLPEAVCIESLLRHEASLRRYLQGVGELNEEDVASMITNVLMLGHTVRAKKLGVYSKIHNW